jgi:hypothetical protein
VIGQRGSDSGGCHQGAILGERGYAGRVVIQLQPASESIQLRMSVTPGVSIRVPRPVGGMALALSRKFMRAGITERLAAPGAMSRALAISRSPSPGATSQALVFASVVA